jgi:type IV pilus assembly protein PilM
MSHTITGIDLGAWSVKFTVLEVGFRRQSLRSCFEEKVPEGEAPLAERQVQALRAGLTRLPHETIPFLALPGEMLTLRVLELPFADARKVEQVVGYELEGQIMHELSEVVMDHAVLASLPGKEGGEAGSRALAVAARTEEIGSFLESMKAVGIDPRSLYAAPLIYHRLFEGRRAVDEEPGYRLFMDIGHRRTNLCVVGDGEPVFGRMVGHAGEALTLALAAASNGAWTVAQAEAGKAQHGFLPTRDRPAQTAPQQRIGQVLSDALSPLLREVRQTLASLRARDKTPVREIVLAGGGANLNGLPEYLQEQLDIPCTRWVPPELPGGDDHTDSTVRLPYALSLAVAWAGARGSRELDLRRGPFQYRASLSIVRQKAMHLAFLAAGLLVAGGVNATVSMRRLSSERVQLQAKLKTATTELFGNGKMEPEEVMSAIKKTAEAVPLPPATAYDLLNEISRRIPSADLMKIDVQELDIRAKKTTIKGTVDSAAAVDDLVAKLKDIECFEEINKGPVTEVSDGAKQFKQFSLTINAKCP